MKFVAVLTLPSKEIIKNNIYTGEIVASFEPSMPKTNLRYLVTNEFGKQQTYNPVIFKKVKEAAQ